MGYRQLKKKHHHQNRTVQKTASPARFFMENGTTFSIAIPCWYKEVHPPIRAHHHCRARHDHIGWPEPRHPDHSCQHHDFAIECHNPYPDIHRHHHHYIDMSELIPIHLSKEGYNEATIVFDKHYDGLYAEAYIDDKDDWVVRVYVTAYIEEAINEPVDVRFMVKVARPGDDDRRIVDVAARGKLKILPAPLEESYE